MFTTGHPEKWWKPVDDTLSTGVTGFHTVKISEMAQRSAQVIEKMRSKS